MMNEEMTKQMAHTMGQGAGMMSHPVVRGAMVAATGYAATRTLVGHGLLRSPLLLLAGGVAGGIAIGYLLHKHEKEIVLAVSRAIGMGKDFVMQQRENLDDLMAEAKETEAQAAAAPASADTQASE
ncbi:MAG: hypothetical protein Q8O34_05520 [Rhodocyclaceae bacterium]|nr:hypothetical protein [Rhodocyclaceae bacterium]